MIEHKDEVLKASGIEKIQPKIPKLNIENFNYLEVQAKDELTDRDVEEFVNSRKTNSKQIQPESDPIDSQIEDTEIDFTKDFEEIFETSRKSFSSQSSQEISNKKPKLNEIVNSESEELMDVGDEIDSFMDCEPTTSTQDDIFNTQAALTNINNLFGNEPKAEDPQKKTAKEQLSENFSKAWLPRVKENSKPNIAKLKPPENKFSNPWATSSSESNKFVPTKSKRNIEKGTKVLSNPWITKPAERKQESIKNIFNASISRERDLPVEKSSNSSIENSIQNRFNAVSHHKSEPQVSIVQPQISTVAPQKPEEKTPFSSFQTGRQLLSLQDASKNIRPQGLSKKHCPSAKNSDPLRKKFQIPFKTENSSDDAKLNDEYNIDDFDHPLLKGFDKNLLERIKRDIVDNKSSQTISWNDIAGLDSVKDLIQQSIVLPILNPTVFGGLRQPPRAFLLFGPPGTGKTLIGKCIANEVDATFMSISASSLTSKWIGESETLVRAMFAYAKVLQPCVIFFDEVDSLLGKRDGDNSSGESMNRLKTEFLIQLDGANSLKDTDKVILIGATNRPHAIDEAMIRRFTKRILIPLPNARARIQLIQNLLINFEENHCLTEEDFVVLAEKTEGYSGADLKNLAHEASHIPFRRAFKIHGSNLEKQDVSLF